MKGQKQPTRGDLWKSVLKISNKFTGEHPCRSVISIKLQSNFTKTTLRHGCSPVNLLLIFRTPFPSNTSGWLLLKGRSCNSWNIEAEAEIFLRKLKMFYGKHLRGGITVYLIIKVWDFHKHAPGDVLLKR